MANFLCRCTWGLGVYAEIEDKVARALAGEQVHYERTQTVGKTLPRDLKITYLPHFDANRKVMGFLALLEDAAVPTFSLEPLDDDAVRAGTLNTGWPKIRWW